ncbi:MAG: hypothetical protein E6J24_12930 [Chloroflexi bacterium]|nr:MAG: hypothetical protein E6J24_12930 [Chloroflexota bacterium]
MLAELAKLRDRRCIHLARSALDRRARLKVHRCSLRGGGGPSRPRLRLAAWCRLLFARGFTRCITRKIVLTRLCGSERAALLRIHAHRCPPPLGTAAGQMPDAPDDAFGGPMLPAVRVDERRGDDKRELVLVGFD